MFNSKQRPLPAAILTPDEQDPTVIANSGIALGSNCLWNPESLPNGHVVAIGGSGSGKTQTLKALAYELPKLYPAVQIMVIDFHGDQQLPGEICYPLNMESPHGINPLMIDLDTKGGGPALQTIAVAAVMKKALVMGPNQEGLLISVLENCYNSRGITQADSKSWTKTPPTFLDVREEVESRIEDGCKESQKLALKLAATFQYGIFDRPQPPITAQIVRFDLSTLGKVPGLGAIAAESLTKQLMDSHRLMGEVIGKVPRTYIFIDEAKEVKGTRSIKNLLCDGRKHGLNAVIASQRDCHIDDDVIANSATKIVLTLDQCEVNKVAKRFRFAPNLVAQLQPLEALVRMGKNGYKTTIIPYYERIKNADR